MDSRERSRARRTLVALSCRLPAGPVALSRLGFPATTFAVLVLRGSLMHETELATGRMIVFVGSGEVLMPFSAPPDMVRGSVTVTATEEVMVAALDQRFIRAAAVWPQLMIVVQRRLGEQQHRLALHGAICQLPRVEQRVLALLWHLAQRCGKVTVEGVILTRRLSHQALGDLVGTRRPTVTLAVTALREQGHLRRRPDGMWLLPDPGGRAGGVEALLGPINDSVTAEALPSEHGATVQSALVSGAARR